MCVCVCVCVFVCVWSGVGLEVISLKFIEDVDILLTPSQSPCGLHQHCTIPHTIPTPANCCFCSIHATIAIYRI